ncbi:MAG: hypothetical protein FH762_16825 [Firmicutes bacterium]|nr:hypothetical protein [Bacillota bacterium]
MDKIIIGSWASKLALIQSRYEIVPGISSVIAAAAYAGIPITHRDYSSSFHVLTAHNPERISFEHLAELKGTIIFLMGLKKLKELTDLLLQHGFSAEKPVAVIYYGTTSEQLVIKGKIETIARKVEASHLSPPVLIVIGLQCFWILDSWEI